MKTIQERQAPIIKALVDAGGEMRSAEIWKVTGIHQTNGCYILKGLVNSHIVTKVRVGVYRLTER